jgi:hypothetical protein
MIALEEHFKDYPCWADCIPKHIMAIRQYLGEAVDLAPEQHREFWIKLKEEFDEWSSGLKQGNEVQYTQEIRQMRKRVMHELDWDSLEAPGIRDWINKIRKAVGRVKAIPELMRICDEIEPVCKKCSALQQCPVCSGLLPLGLLALTNNACPTNMEKTDHFCVEIVKPLEHFDERSIRSVKRDGHMVKVGCPKGEWDAKTKRCKVGTEAHSIWHPVEEVKKEWEKHVEKGKHEVVV